MGDLLKELNKVPLSANDSKVSPEQLVELLEKVDSGAISHTNAKDVFEEMFNSGNSAADIIKDKGLEQINDSSELEDMLNRAEIIDVAALSGNTVKFGATVELVDEDTDVETTYQIVGEYEANVEAGKISIASPIARALIGKEVGDSVEVNTPGGGKSYEILGVKFI